MELQIHLGHELLDVLGEVVCRVDRDVDGRLGAAVSKNAETLRSYIDR